QLPIMELQERVEQELEENPVLEREDGGDVAVLEEDGVQPEEKEVDPDGPLVMDEDNQLDFNRLEALNKDWEDHFNEEHRPSRTGIEEEGDRKHDAMQNKPSRPPTLHDHLIEQVSFLDVEPEQFALLRYVISHVADNGWLGNFVAKEEPGHDEKNGKKK